MRRLRQEDRRKNAGERHVDSGVSSQNVWRIRFPRGGLPRSFRRLHSKLFSAFTKTHAAIHKSYTEEVLQGRERKRDRKKVYAEDEEMKTAHARGTAMGEREGRCGGCRVSLSSPKIPFPSPKRGDTNLRPATPPPQTDSETDRSLNAKSALECSPGTPHRGEASAAQEPA